MPVSIIFIYLGNIPASSFQEGDMMAKNLYDANCTKQVFGAYFCKKPAEDCCYQNWGQTMGAPMFDREKGCVTLDLPQCTITSVVMAEYDERQLREKERR